VIVPTPAGSAAPALGGIASAVSGIPSAVAGVPSALRAAAVAAGIVLATGTAALAYATLVEPRMFTLRRVDLAVLPRGAWPIRILHLSDLHIVPGQQAKVDWVSSLADLRPDLVINTGDTIAHARAVPTAVAAFGGLLDMPGAFVFGNNDFYAPLRKSPHKYFMKRPEKAVGPPLPWRDLRAAQAERGWVDLSNAATDLTVLGQRLWLGGVDDPFTRRDRFERIAGRADPGALIRVGALHAPEPRVLDQFAADGYELLLAGHTHGGQVRVPGIGALVTNCDLDRSRARGLSRWGVDSWLNVSAGLGASPFMPMRFACRPEATLITLRASDRRDQPSTDTLMGGRRRGAPVI
jgi:uncharacterized protein